MPRLTPRRLLWILPLATVLLGLFLFVLNGTLLSSGETPLAGTTTHPAAALPAKDPPFQVKILAWNIAKCFVYQEGSGIWFELRETIEERLGRMAAVINAEKPDLVFLSETIKECGPCPVDQVANLALATGMHSWAFGENFNFGMPGYRIVGGNAILSRWPLTAVANPSLVGRKPFWVTKNNRRVLWASVDLAGKPLLLASIHNDSFDLNNNLKQVQQILDFLGDRPAILAGDFNARPADSSMEWLRLGGRFSGAFEGRDTFPSDKPDRRIDFILAPAGWELVEERVIAEEVSDHRPVVAVFRVAP
jgi:endonuclease/exonuclease/phosphatase family metal-dependent hydrolase